MEWLFRLSSEEWLRAARNELELAYDRLQNKKRREGLTYARRAAGMALNAMLVKGYEESYGRSYMDHLHALAVDDKVTAELREHARRLVYAPMTVDLVVLGPAPVDLADDASAIIDYVRACVNEATVS
jgi:HEPN domain-containing protein